MACTMRQSGGCGVGKISFCEDVDAYNTNTTFMKSCGDYIKMLNGGKTEAMVQVMIFEAVGWCYVRF
jgi:hypothetical protein